MAAQNHTNPAASFSIGVEIDSAGRIASFAHGQINVGIAEHVAGQLLELAYAVRAEAREIALAA